jgi:hypothetical protein
MNIKRVAILTAVAVVLFRPLVFAVHSANVGVLRLLSFCALRRFKTRQRFAISLFTLGLIC